ncbi:ABC transporter substrate-binding protein [Desulfoluna spongiiphila]|uniref:ABC transporter substrate-binding protein n=1 Tax=Desulfoluna spongiiphila TaxID=419481 RepID=UPI0012549C8A|nr:hypothetical protein [Desulfoluna spongiiphila]VVS94967.1 hypothetical protein DBB_45440 [Desulfoluna spongiiphila]
MTHAVRTPGRPGVFSSRFLFLMLAALCVAAAWPGRTCAANRPVIKISGPPVAESLPFAMMSGMTFDDPAMTVQFTPWHSPDQIRAMIAGGQVDGAIVTTASASLFYHKGVHTKLAALFETPLWIISTAESAGTCLEDLGGTILFPFGHKEMPELLFNALLGPEPPKITRHHTGGALEAVNLLILGKGHHALLAEPAATLAVMRSKEMADKGAPPLTKNLDLRTLWKKKFDGKPLYVSGFALFGDALDNPAMVRRILEEYDRGVERIAAHPEQAMAMADNSFPALAAQSKNGTLPGVDIHVTSDPQAFSDTLFFLDQLSRQAPRATGGGLPENDFFLVTQ